MAFLLVYDVTNQESFNTAKQQLKEIERHASADVETIVLGNKCDMEDKRKVTKEQGMQLAQEHNVKFMETSAMNRTNVEMAFTEVASDIKHKMDQREVADPFSNVRAPVPIMSAKERKRHDADEKKRREHEAAIFRKRLEEQEAAANEKALSAEKERLVQEAAAAEAAEQKRREQTAAAARAKARFVTALVGLLFLSRMKS